MCVCVYFLTISTTQDTLIVTSFYEMIAVPCFHGTRWPKIDINIMLIMVLLKRYVQLQVECHLICREGSSLFLFFLVFFFFHSAFYLHLCLKSKKKGMSLGGAGRAVNRERIYSVMTL